MWWCRVEGIICRGNERKWNRCWRRRFGFGEFKRCLNGVISGREWDMLATFEVRKRSLAAVMGKWNRRWLAMGKGS